MIDYTLELDREAKIRLKVLDDYLRLKRLGKKINIRWLCRFKWTIHHSTFYQWKRRFNPRNLATLKTKKRGPKHPKRASWQVVIRVCDWKRANPVKGSEYCYQELLRETKGQPPCCAKTIYNIWKRRNLLYLGRRRKSKRPRKPRLVKQAKNKGDLIQMDTKYLVNGRF